MLCKIVEEGPLSAEENMRRDFNLLANAENFSHPILHFYDWESDAATYGLFTNPADFLNLEAIKEYKIELAKRPTGGGIIFHISDCAFAFVVPAGHPAYSMNTLDNYAFVNRKVIQAIELFLGINSSQKLSLLDHEPQPLDEHCKAFCMAKPTKYDVIFHGKKVGGAAQRRTKDGFLHQGSISLGALPEHLLKKVLLPNHRVLEAMRQNEFSLLQPDWTASQLSQSRQHLKNCLKQVFIS